MNWDGWQWFPSPESWRRPFSTKNSLFKEAAGKTPTLILICWRRGTTASDNPPADGEPKIVFSKKNWFFQEIWRKSCKKFPYMSMLRDDGFGQYANRRKNTGCHPYRWMSVRRDKASKSFEIRRKSTEILPYRRMSDRWSKISKKVLQSGGNPEGFILILGDNP